MDITTVRVNDRLMAAAPDLLAACKEALHLYSHGIGTLALIDEKLVEWNMKEAERILAMLETAIAKAEAFEDPLDNRR
jgi:hypothetical protein